MKIIYLFLLVSSVFCQAQKNPKAYQNFKNKIEKEGFLIQNEKQFYLQPGELETVYFGLYKGRNYKIFFMSDDPSVNDLDVELYDFSNNTLLASSISGKEKMVIVNYRTAEKKEALLKCKNIHSDTPSKKSRCYVIVAYKE